MPERASEDIFYKYVKEDLKPVDKGIASVVGEDEEFVWTQKGKTSSLGAPAWAREGYVVNDGTLWQQHCRKA